MAMATNNTENFNIHSALRNFEEMWEEVTHGNKSHTGKLLNLATKIKIAKLDDTFLLSELSENEMVIVRNAILLARGM